MDGAYFALMPVFVQVANRSSFSDAAEDLQISTATVSRKIVELEKLMGVRLFERSTRKVSLTEIGKAFHERCLQLMQQAEEAALSIEGLQSEPRGTLRITTPILFGTMHLAPLVREFMARYPAVKVEMHVSDQLESLSTGQYDLAIRITNHLDDTVVARRLTSINWTVCASPDYLAQNGMPLVPNDLKEHNCYFYPSVVKQGRWHFVRNSIEYVVPIQGRLQVNNSLVIAEHVRAGMGIGLLPNYLIGDDLRASRLVELLPDYQPSVNSALYAVSLPNRYMTAKVHRFLDLLNATFCEPAQWDPEAQKGVV